MKKEALTTKLFSLSCQDEDGILSRIIQTFSRPNYPIVTLSQARTDVREVVLITLEVRIPAAKVDHMVLRLEKIIGVLEVTCSFGAIMQYAVYRLSSCTAETLNVLRGHQAQTITQHQDHWLSQQSAHPSDIQRLYNELGGPALVGFSQLPIAISQPLCWEEVKSLESAESNAEVGPFMSF
jgi:acetolactate synthase small subunit